MAENENKSPNSVGYKRPPKNRQFGQPEGNPRHDGGQWRKEDSARYKLERMLKMSSKELQQVSEDADAPLFERKLANCIRTGNWKELKEMMHEVYGMPKQQVEVEGAQTILMTKEDMENIASM